MTTAPIASTRIAHTGAAYLFTAPYCAVCGCDA